MSRGGLLHVGYASASSLSESMSTVTEVRSQPRNSSRLAHPGWRDGGSDSTYEASSRAWIVGWNRLDAMTSANECTGARSPCRASQLLMSHLNWLQPPAVRRRASNPGTAAGSTIVAP